MASREEIADLKAQWAADPCWDIWATEGFEAHTEELRQYQAEYERAAQARYRSRIATGAANLGVSEAMAEYIDRLEQRLAKLEARHG